MLKRRHIWGKSAPVLCTFNTNVTLVSIIGIVNKEDMWNKVRIITQQYTRRPLLRTTSMNIENNREM